MSTNSKKKLGSRKRVKSMAAGPGKTLAGPIITFKRGDTIVLPKVAGDAGNALWSTLSSFTSSDIVSLFSFYKVTNVKLTWRLVNAPNNNATFPTLWIAPRQYSTTAPASLDEVQQYNGVTSYQFGPNRVSYTRNFKPSLQASTRTSTGVGNGLTMPFDWVSTDLDTAAFFFAVFWVQRYNSAPDSSHTLEIDYVLTVEAKQPR